MPWASFLFVYIVWLSLLGLSRHSVIGIRVVRNDAYNLAQQELDLDDGTVVESIDNAPIKTRSLDDAMRHGFDTKATGDNLSKLSGLKSKLHYPQKEHRYKRLDDYISSRSFIQQQAEADRTHEETQAKIHRRALAGDKEAQATIAADSFSYGMHKEGPHDTPDQAAVGKIGKTKQVGDFKYHGKMNGNDILGIQHDYDPAAELLAIKQQEKEKEAQLAENVNPDPNMGPEVTDDQGRQTAQFLQALSQAEPVTPLAGMGSAKLPTVPRAVAAHASSSMEAQLRAEMNNPHQQDKLLGLKLKQAAIIRGFEGQDEEERVKQVNNQRESLLDPNDGYGGFSLFQQQQEKEEKVQQQAQQPKSNYPTSYPSDGIDFHPTSARNSDNYWAKEEGVGGMLATSAQLMQTSSSSSALSSMNMNSMMTNLGGEKRLDAKQLSEDAKMLTQRLIARSDPLAGLKAAEALGGYGHRQNQEGVLDATHSMDPAHNGLGVAISPFMLQKFEDDEDRDELGGWAVPPAGPEPDALNGLPKRPASSSPSSSPSSPSVASMFQSSSSTSASYSMDSPSKSRAAPAPASSTSSPSLSPAIAALRQQISGNAPGKQLDYGKALESAGISNIEQLKQAAEKMGWIPGSSSKESNPLHPSFRNAINKINSETPSARQSGLNPASLYAGGHPSMMIETSSKIRQRLRFPPPPPPPPHGPPPLDHGPPPPPLGHRGPPPPHGGPPPSMTSAVQAMADMSLNVGAAVRQGIAGLNGFTASSLLGQQFAPPPPQSQVETARLGGEANVAKLESALGELGTQALIRSLKEHPQDLDPSTLTDETTDSEEKLGGLLGAMNEREEDEDKARAMQAASPFPPYRPGHGPIPGSLVISSSSSTIEDRARLTRPSALGVLGSLGVGGVEMLNPQMGSVVAAEVMEQMENGDNDLTEEMAAEMPGFHPIDPLQGLTTRDGEPPSGE